MWKFIEIYVMLKDYKGVRPIEIKSADAKQ